MEHYLIRSPRFCSVRNTMATVYPMSLDYRLDSRYANSKAIVAGPRDVATQSQVPMRSATTKWIRQRRRCSNAVNQLQYNAWQTKHSIHRFIFWRDKQKHSIGLAVARPPCRSSPELKILSRLHSTMPNMFRAQPADFHGSTTDSGDERQVPTKYIDLEVIINPWMLTQFNNISCLASKSVDKSINKSVNYSSQTILC